MSERVDYEREGYEAGKSAGSWVTDGFNDTSQYRWILKGIEEGDLEVMDLEPLPLSRERASESIGELIEGYADMPDDGVEQDAACTEYDRILSRILARGRTVVQVAGRTDRSPAQPCRPL